MSDKVKTAVFGKDLRVKFENHKLNATGHKISIVKEGAGYFMPEIGPTTFLDMPLRKKYLFFGPVSYERVYFTEKKGSKCVDFGEGGKVYGPDPEQVKKANMALLAGKIGQDSNKGIPWYIWGMLGLNVVSFLLLLQLAGVIR